MSRVIITFENEEAYELQRHIVNQMLQNIGLQEGDYPEIPKFPPVKIIPEAVKKLDDATFTAIGDLDGVAVQYKDEDDDSPDGQASY